jgi:hypothetical protein
VETHAPARDDHSTSYFSWGSTLPVHTTRTAPRTLDSPHTGMARSQHSGTLLILELCGHCDWLSLRDIWDSHYRSATCSCENFSGPSTVLDGWCVHG